MVFIWSRVHNNVINKHQYKLIQIGMENPIHVLHKHTRSIRHTELHTIRSHLSHQTQISELFNRVQLSNHQSRHVQGL